MTSKLIRRVHLYLGLFLTPWLVMYALSTIAMNHRAQLREWTGRTMPAWQAEREAAIGEAPAGLDDKARAAWVLAQLDMTGAHQINSVKTPPGTMVITRLYAFNNRRVTYEPAERRAKIEHQTFQWNFWLEKMHRRRGYQHAAWTDDLWAGTVDLVIVAMGLWVATGFWMWWELKKTRRLGAIFALGGIALFALFLLKG